MFEHRGRWRYNEDQEDAVSAGGMVRPLLAVADCLASMLVFPA